MNVSTLTIVVSADLLSPTPAASSSMTTPEHTEEVTDVSESAAEGDPNGILLRLVLQNKDKSSYTKLPVRTWGHYR